MNRASFLKGAAALALAPAVGRAQGAWPDKQIRMVIPVRRRLHHRPSGRARWAST